MTVFVVECKQAFKIFELFLHIQGKFLPIWFYEKEKQPF